MKRRQYLFDWDDYMRNDSLAVDYASTIKGMYDNAKVAKDSKLVKWIGRKINNGLTARLYKKLGFESTQINLGPARLGKLKPTRKELKQLQSNRIVY